MPLLMVRMSARPGKSSSQFESALAPVVPQERVEVLDILRGWALFGILLVDMGWDQDLTALDHAIDQFLIFFGGSKFWTLLSFLFGLGFSLQLTRAEQKGQELFGAYLRRLFTLLMIGTLQLIFLFWGGWYLIRYAMLGLLLYALRGLPTRTLLPVAIAFLLTPWTIDIGTDFIRERRLADPQTRLQVLQADAALEAQRTEWRIRSIESKQGGYLARVEFQARSLYASHIDALWRTLTGQSPLGRLVYIKMLISFGLFLVGLYAGRRRILEDLPAQLPMVRLVLIWGLAIGLANSAVRFFFPDSVNQPLVQMLDVFGNPALALAYGATIVLLVEKGWWRRLFRALAPAGRMALTIYLLEAVLVMVVIRPAFRGLDVIHLSPTTCVAVTFGTYVGLMLLSRWWLERFRFGPAEWLWRSATYAKWQPMRIAPAAKRINS